MHWYHMAESKAAMVNKESMSEEESSHNSSCMSLQHSSSSFKGHSSASNGSNEEASQRSVVPYLYEPEHESGSEAESREFSDGENRLEKRLLNYEW